MVLLVDSDVLFDWKLRNILYISEIATAIPLADSDLLMRDFIAKFVRILRFYKSLTQNRVNEAMKHLSFS